MKTVCLIFALLFPIGVFGETVSIYGSELKLTNDCKLTARTNGDAKSVSLDLQNPSGCKFIKFAETDVIHLERIGNVYLALVESTNESKEGCISNYTAIALYNDGRVVPAPISKTSGTCHIDRERSVFECFSHKMKILK